MAIHQNEGLRLSSAKVSLQSGARSALSNGGSE